MALTQAGDAMFATILRMVEVLVMVVFVFVVRQSWRVVWCMVCLGDRYWEEDVKALRSTARGERRNVIINKAAVNGVESCDSHGRD